jgi:hypothetical protein
MQMSGFCVRKPNGNLHQCRLCILFSAMHVFQAETRLSYQRFIDADDMCLNH